MQNKNDKLTAAVNKMRTESARNDAKRDAGLPTSYPDVIRFDNLSYGEYGTENLLDIYLPRQGHKPYPTVIDIHGGGFVYGDKELYQHYCLWWARQGFAVVNFNYRLAPKTVFPGALQDVSLAVKWVADHAAEYDIDTQNVFITGDSAGGNLAQQYVTAHTNDDYRQALGLAKAEIKIKAAALNCGVYFLDRPDILPDDELLALAYYVPSVRRQYADQLKTENYMSEKLPPLFVMTANNDFLHDEGVRMDQFLIDHNLPHEFHIYGDNDHPRGHVFHIDQRDEIGIACNNDEKAFFEAHLK
jgi:acetyl esterase/lipase